MSHGHFGLSMLIASLIFIPFAKFGLITLNEYTYVVVMISAFSFAPDLDLYIEYGNKRVFEHRGISHSILCAIIAGIVALVFGIYLKLSTTLILFTFPCGFLAIMLHCLGDLPTHAKLRMFFYPFSKNEYGGLEMFYANDKGVNEVFFIGGVIAFALIYQFVILGAPIV